MNIFVDRFSVSYNKGLSDQAQQALAELSGNVYDDPDPFNDSSLIHDEDINVVAQNEPLLCAIRDIASQEQYVASIFQWSGTLFDI